jgi:DNA polymerase III gamma/tau subunit
MHSFIIIGSSAEARLAEAKSRTKAKSSGVDLIITENPKGIDSAREIKSYLTRKPYQSEAITIILREAQALTPEAQNALLKTLEEPPGPTQIYITAPSAESFLPTLRSRCQIINLGPAELIINEEHTKKAWYLWKEGRLSKLFDATDIEPLTWSAIARALLFHRLGTDEKQINEIVGKEEFQDFSKTLSTENLKKFLKTCQYTNELIASNVNRKLAMENLFLELPKSSVSP